MMQNNQVNYILLDDQSQQSLDSIHLKAVSQKCKQIINKICKNITKQTNVTYKLFSGISDKKSDIERNIKEKQFMRDMKYHICSYQEPLMPIRKFIDVNFEDKLLKQEDEVEKTVAAAKFISRLREKKKQIEGRNFMIKKQQEQRKKQVQEIRQAQETVMIDLDRKLRRIKAQKNIEYIENKQLLSEYRRSKKASRSISPSKSMSPLKQSTLMDNAETSQIEEELKCRNPLKKIYEIQREDVQLQPEWKTSDPVMSRDNTMCMKKQRNEIKQSKRKGQSAQLFQMGQTQESGVMKLTAVDDINDNSWQESDDLISSHCRHKISPNKLIDPKFNSQRIQYHIKGRHTRAISSDRPVEWLETNFRNNLSTRNKTQCETNPQNEIMDLRSSHRFRNRYNQRQGSYFQKVHERILARMGSTKHNQSSLRPYCARKQGNGYTPLLDNEKLRKKKLRTFSTID